MNLKEATFVTYRRRKGRYTENLEFEDIQLEDTNSDMDLAKGKGNRGRERQVANL